MMERENGKDMEHRADGQGWSCGSKKMDGANKKIGGSHGGDSN